MKKSGVSMVLVLLVTVFGVFAARSVARTPDPSNFLLRSQNWEEDQQVAGLPTCCDMCKYCDMVSCMCTDTGTIAPLSVCRRKCSSNILVTRQTLGPGERLAYGNYFFEMQRDCNLVLSNILTGEVLFSSNTSTTFEPNCRLSFDDYGRLSIHSTVKGEHFTIFTIPKEKSKEGDYIAVLRPDGKVAIYGPRVWSVPPPVNKIDKEGDIYKSTESLIRNVLYVGEQFLSGQELQSHDRLTRFILKDGNLMLYSGGGTTWQSSNTECRNKPYALLNNFGQLEIFEEFALADVPVPGRRTCWTSSPPHDEGEYVLAVPDDGLAAIYGPMVATIPAEESTFKGIRMVTTE